MLPKRESYHELLAYFSVTQRKVLDGYGEISILKAFGINIPFYNNNWAPGNVSMSQAFYIHCSLADCCLYCGIFLSPTEKDHPSSPPLKLHEAANPV